MRSITIGYSNRHRDATSIKKRVVLVDTDMFITQIPKDEEMASCIRTQESYRIHKKKKEIRRKEICILFKNDWNLVS